MNRDYWEKAKAFHGHACPGLAIGVRACEAAAEMMGLSPAFDEELVCVSENDACGVDAIQALMSCTLGKGNLVLNLTGKQAFTFINRADGRAMRFYLKASDRELDREQRIEHILNAPLDQVFAWCEAAVAIPEKARRFPSIACELCGEAASEHKIRVQDGKMVCLDCFREYGRGW